MSAPENQSAATPADFGFLKSKRIERSETINPQPELFTAP